MNAMTDNIDLNPFSVDDLKRLMERVKQEIYHKEQAQVLEIRQRMDELASRVGMTPEQVLSFDSRKKITSAPTVKYRNHGNPEQTWSGRGKRPNWLTEAINQGANLEEFKVEP